MDYFENLMVLRLQIRTHVEPISFEALGSMLHSEELLIQQGNTPDSSTVLVAPTQ